jgi:hypothetical protein
MQKLNKLGLRAGALGALALLCTGCPNPNTYGTPRTTPVGKVQHTVAAEGVRFAVDNTKNGGENDSATLPNVPTYQLRVGVLDTLDIGARLANLTSLGVDVKWNFIKSEAFDLAFDPGFQIFHLSTSSNNSTGSYTQMYGHVPLIFGINVADSVSIVPTAGITYGSSSATANNGDGASAAASIDGLMFRGGLGFNFRVSPKFAIHPEVTYLKYLNKTEDPSISWVIFGLGFNFGNLPQYGTPAPAEK